MSRYLLILLLLGYTAGPVCAQTHREQFQHAFGEGDFEQAGVTLNAWEKEDPEDAELFVACFNYYYRLALQSGVQLSTAPGYGDQLEITDEESGETVGYLSEQMVRNDSLFDLALSWINRGIGLHPSRLDMYFGRTYALREMERLDAHLTSILEVISVQDTNPVWTWSEGEPLEDAETVFKEAIQQYMYVFFSMNPPFLTGVDTISLRMNRLYPDDPVNYSNLGVVRLYREDPEGALRYFRKGLAIDPADMIIAGNLAYAHRQLEQWEEAIRIYNQIIERGDPEEAEFAREQLEMINKEE